eukprot:1515392-Amphidinium_carterae.1
MLTHRQTRSTKPRSIHKALGVPLSGMILMFVLLNFQVGNSATAGALFKGLPAKKLVRIALPGRGGSVLARLQQKAMATAAAAAAARLHAFDAALQSGVSAGTPGRILA